MSELIKNVILNCLRQYLKLNVVNILIVDKETLLLINELFLDVELGRLRIYDVNLITNYRCSMQFSSFTHVIYFVRGSIDNIRLIVNDYSNLDEIIYAKAHLLLTSEVDQDSMKYLSQSKIMPYILSFYQIPLNFTLVDRVVTFRAGVAPSDNIQNILRILEYKPIINHIKKESIHITLSEPARQIGDCDLLIIDRSSVSPLMYDTRINFLSHFSGITDLPDNTNSIWKILRCMDFAKAHKLFTSVYKNKYDSLVKTRDKQSIAFIRFYREYNACIKALNALKPHYERISKVVDIQSKLAKGEKVSDTIIATAMNQTMLTQYERRRFVLSFSSFGLSLEIIKKAGLDISSFNPMQSSMTLKDIVEKHSRKHRPLIIYVSDYVSLEELSIDSDILVLSPKILSSEEIVNNALTQFSI
jgi:hypothetical protein